MKKQINYVYNFKTKKIEKWLKENDKFILRISDYVIDEIKNLEINEKEYMLKNNILVIHDYDDILNVICNKYNISEFDKDLLEKSLEHKLERYNDRDFLD